MKTYNVTDEISLDKRYNHSRTGSSNGGVKTFDVTVRKLYTLHGG